MKRLFLFIIALFINVFIFSGCITTHSLFYDYDVLRQDIVKAEIIYMETEIIFFRIHWYVDVDDIEYEVKKVLSSEEIERLIKSLSEMEFKYRILWIPASVSNIFTMQGYGIKLHYGDNQFMIIAKTGDFRYGMPRLPQVRAGRRASDEDWNAFISEFYFD